MLRKIGLMVLVLVLVAAMGVAAEESSRFRGELLKTADTMTSIGFGVGYEVVELSEGRGLWLDAAPLFYDNTNVDWGVFVGLSTELSGIPVLGDLFKPIEKLFNSGATSAGYGYSTISERGMWYGVWSWSIDF